MGEERDKLAEIVSLIEDWPVGRALSKSDLLLLVSALAATEARAEKAEGELEHLKSEFHYMQDRGDSVVYRSEREAFDKWQRGGRVELEAERDAALAHVEALEREQRISDGIAQSAMEKLITTTSLAEKLAESTRANVGPGSGTTISDAMLLALTAWEER